MEKKIDEVNINEPKVFTKKTPAKKKPAPKKKEAVITEQYQYKGEGELIMDKPSEPLQVSIQEPVQITIPEPVIKKGFSNKEIFENLSRERQNFVLKYNGSLIYDTEGKLNKISKDLSFEEDYFVLYGRKYLYDGLNFKFKR